MNLIFLQREDFIALDRVRLTGRRCHHVLAVHRATEGDELIVGVEGGRIGRGRVESLAESAIELSLKLEQAPPSPLPLILLLALPRPKVLNRVVVTAASMGVKRIFLMNCWRVEKSYWETPRLDPGNLRAQSILGLEQARDTVLPEIRIARRFRPFVEDELPSLVQGTRALVAHPGARGECPRGVSSPVTLAIGPEGGFIENEIEMLVHAGFEPVSLGARVLRVEAIVPALIGRLF